MRSTADSDALPVLLGRAWSMLATASENPAAAMRLLTVATGGADGPDARTMVLRAVDPQAGMIGFYTDRRAAKVAMMIADPRVAIVGYEPVSRIQLRLQGRASVATSGDNVDSAWSAIGEDGRDAYRAVPAPGSPIEQPSEGWPSADRSGRADFAVVTIVLTHIEWLELTRRGHRRAAWTFADDGWAGSWRVP